MIKAQSQNPEPPEDSAGILSSMDLKELLQVILEASVSLLTGHLWKRFIRMLTFTIIFVSSPT
jgi:hypothetical protein